MPRYPVSLLAMAAIAAACTSPPEPATDQEAPLARETTAVPAAGLVAPPSTDAERIANAMAAAPAAIGSAATILAFGDDGQPRTLREGTNGWTCMPDYPASPGVDPMCVDPNGMEWAMAWIARRDPPPDQMGLGYMLMGGSDASNSNPFAEGPADGATWVDTGPHVMIFNIGDRFAGYPTTAENTHVPYVMWSDTPYRHLMVPVE